MLLYYAAVSLFFWAAALFPVTARAGEPIDLLLEDGEVIVDGPSSPEAVARRQRMRFCARLKADVSAAYHNLDDLYALVERGEAWKRVLRDAQETCLRAYAGLQDCSSGTPLDADTLEEARLCRYRLAGATSTRVLTAMA